MSSDKPDHDPMFFKKLLDNAYDYKEALERQNLKQEDVNRLRELVQGSENVPKVIADQQLLLFLNAFKNDVEKSAKKIESFYKLKQTTPEFFENRDLESEAVQSSLDHQDYIGLPVTPDNCNLIFHRLSSSEPHHYVFDDAVKTFVITSEAYAYHHGPRSGTVFIFDLKGVGFRHLFQPSISSLRKGMRFLEDGSPFDIKAVHILNTVSFMNLIVGLVKPFVMTEILSKITFHSSSMDHEKFYEECVPKSHLPSDFGGDLESVEELHKKHRAKLMTLREYFLMEEQQQYSKSKQDEFIDHYTNQEV